MQWDLSAVTFMHIYIQLVLGQMSDVVVSVGQYERHSLPWSLLASDFTDHAKYQIIQQVSQLTISTLSL